VFGGGEISKNAKGSLPVSFRGVLQKLRKAVYQKGYIWPGTLCCPKETAKKLLVGTGGRRISIGLTFEILENRVGRCSRRSNVARKEASSHFFNVMLLGKVDELFLFGAVDF
jgi:hypothetical protein